MSKENLKRFLEKVSTDQTLAETVITLAKENGFELTADDFISKSRPCPTIE